MKIKYFISASVLMVIFSAVWVFIETLIYGAPETRVVDDIMILMMFPCFYITAAWLDEKTSRPKDYTTTIEDKNEGD